MNILVTGGAGFIGSHTVVSLIENGHDVAIVDNLVNSSPIAVKRVESIVGKKIPFYECDIRDREGLEKVFSDNTFDAVILFLELFSKVISYSTCDNKSS